jgi:hypothetical protein
MAMPRKAPQQLAEHEIRLRVFVVDDVVRREVVERLGRPFVVRMIGHHLPREAHVGGRVSERADRR